jgi:hypothetical protein
VAVKGNELEVIQSPDEAIEALRGKVTVKIEDPAEIQRQMMERILDSENVEDILGRNAATHAQDMLDRPLMLNSVRYLRSKFKDGLPVFAVMEVTDGETGQPHAVTCSAQNVMTQAAMLWKLDALPIGVVIRRAEEPTANGYYPLWLERA